MIHSGIHPKYASNQKKKKDDTSKKTKHVYSIQLTLTGSITFTYSRYMQQTSDVKTILFYLIEGLFILNIFILNFFVFHFISTSRQTTQVVTQTQQVILTPTPSLLNPVAQTTTIPTVTTAPQNQPAVSQQTGNSVKEYFVPLGTGTTSSGTWTSISGAAAYVDSGNYPHIKQVVFEASVSVPTVNQSVNVRLYDVTDQHPVWFSDVILQSGSSGQFLVSQPITLDAGNKLYQVQMQTQLQYVASLDQSRIHITLQ